MKIFLPNKLRVLLLSAFFAVFSSFSGFSQLTLTTVNGWNAYVHLPDDYNTTGTQTYPAIIFFPGTGEVGTDPSKLLINGPGHFLSSGWNGNVVLNGVTIKPIYILLQPPSLWPPTSIVAPEIDLVKTMYRIDPTRVSLTGLSMGGWVSELYVESYPSKIASVVAVQAVKPDDNPAYPTPFATFAQDCGHWLGYEQVNDGRDMITINNTMNAAVSGSAQYFQTNVGGGGHCCWNTWYDPTHTDSYSLNGVTGNWSIYQFMMTWSGCTTGLPKIAPTVGAGSAQTITLPVSTVTLTGTATGNNGATISSVAWTEVSGGAATITTATNLSTTVTGLIAGAYVFKLTATDNNGLTNSSTVNITVNPAIVNTPPTVTSGSAQTITLPVSTVTLTGTATGNSGATISSVAWTEVSGGAATITTATNLSTTVTGLVAGAYVFKLTATDNNGLTNSANVNITVNPAIVNTPPTVTSGSAQTITLPVSTVTLTGTATGNNGATISSVDWSEVSGGAATITTATNLSTTVTGLVAGAYVFKLTATDNNGLTNSSTVNITVNPAVVNTPPTVTSGSAQIITLPMSTVTLTGTASGNNGATISSVDWSEVSGGAATITTATNLSTTITGIAAGTYVFKLTATDNNGLSSSSTVTITVNAAPNVPPTVSAGSAQTITLPISTVTLTGTAAGNNGATISSVTWTEVSGNPDAITSPSSLTTTITGLAAGTYVYKLTATDNNGLSSSSTVTITVNAAPNVPPTVTSGTAQTITLPVSTVTLTGTATGNNGATISSVDWSEVSGGAATITSATNLSTTITGLAAGTYVYKLTATDNNGLSSSSTVTITVNAAPNVPPTVTSGTAQTITLPVSTVTLTGTATGNNGATISSVTWTEVSGGAATITSATNLSTTITGLGAGTYIFELTATDNNGLSSSSNDTIIVNALGNACGCDITLSPDPVSGQVYLNGQTLGVQPGNKVCLKSGHYISVYLYNFYGTKAQPITIVNCGGPVTISGYSSYGFTIHSSQYVHITGTGDPATQRGIIIDGSVANTAYGFGQDGHVSDIEVDHFEVFKTGVGIGCAPTPTCDSTTWSTSWKMYNMSFHDNYVHETVGEGFYIGNTVAYYTFNCSGTTVTVQPQQIDSVKFYNNVIDKSGFTSAQISQVTGGVDIHDNVVTNYGYSNTQEHQAGIIVGGISRGRVYNNRISNGTGAAFQCFGAGLTQVYNNLFVNNGYDGSVQGLAAVLVDDRPKPPGFPGLKLYFINNTIVTPKRNGISFYNDYGTVDVGNIIANNIISAPGLFATYPTYSYADLQSNPHATLYNNLFVPTVAVVKFADPTNNNFHLLANSPAVDSGMNTSPYGVVNDIEGTPRPYGSAYDIGAYEFNSGNQPPVAKTGAAQTILLPNNSASLDGTKSYDPDGSITAYNWTQTSGPGGDALTNATSSTASVSGLIQGIYIFQLVVTDDKGATGTALDTVIVTIPANQLPVAKTGPAQTIMLPNNSASLDGTKSYDPDGSITVYNWTQTSGPAGDALTNATSSTASVSGLIQGTYIFKLIVTDNSGATAIAFDTVIVTAPINLPPVANAGASKSITLPLNNTTLDGSLSYDPDGSIVSYNWVQSSGPSTATITGVSSPVAAISNLVAGVYTFELTVTDNSGASSNSLVKVTVSPSGAQPPVANAGANQSITLPVNTVVIDGSGSSASSGSIISFIWTEKSGPSTVSLSNTAKNTLTSLQAGIYIFYLTVTDNNSATGTDSVIITVNPASNIAPVANAGVNQTITLPTNSVNLNGSASYDPDGTITAYSWTNISGPGSVTINNSNTVTPSVIGLQTGVYVFELTVTDNNGATAKDQVTITVLAPVVLPNQAPIANAGVNQTITSPASSAILNGSASYDPDGTITAYSWTTISGPGSVTINNSNTATPSVIGLQTGVYVFELTVTDNSGATAKDQVTITVLPPVVLPNQAPVANAGNNQTITAPINSVSLNGTSSFDPDGTITSYSWSQVSGPSASVISAANTSTPTVSQLIAGQYVFKLIVTDNNGATGSDQVTITVNPPVTKVNMSPVADAGNSDTVYLPNNTFTLNASQSFDPDGTIASYQWQQISGPNTVTSSSMSNSEVTISNLQAGDYEFQLTVTDNEGATSTATIKITVVPESSLNDQFIVYPNPAHDVLNGKIVSSITGSVKIYVYDMNGRMVLATEVEKSDNVIVKTMNVSALASGTYAIEINIANRKTMVAKFVKN